MVETRETAECALDAFTAIYGVKCERAVECLIKVVKRCWLSMISQPSTGNIYAPQTRSKARSRPFGPDSTMAPRGILAI